MPCCCRIVAKFILWKKCENVVIGLHSPVLLGNLLVGLVLCAVHAPRYPHFSSSYMFIGLEFRNCVVLVRGKLRCTLISSGSQVCLV
jgi:hypothetical protein